MNWEAISFAPGASFPVLQLIQELSLEAKAIFLVILGAFLAGVWNALKMRISLRQEALALKKVQARCRSLQEQGAAWDLDTAQNMIAGILPADALVCHRIDDLHAVREKGGEVNREALAATTVARLSLRMSLLRYVTGVLILIGLTGTLVGLTQAVIGLSSSVKIQHEGGVSEQRVDMSELRQLVNRLYEDVDKLFTSIKQTLAGMKTAFLTSLWAIGLTILLTFCSHLLQNAQTRFLADLEDFTTRELVPFFVPPKVEDSLKDLVGVLKDGIEQVVAVVEEVEDPAGQASENLRYLFILVREFDAGRKGFDESVRKLIENQQVLTEGFAAAVNRLGDSDTSLREVISQLQTFCTDNTGLREAIEQEAALQKELREELQRFSASSEDLFTRRLTGILAQESQRFVQGLLEQREANRTLLRAFGQGTALQQTANDLLRQLLAGQSREDQLSKEQVARLLEHQQQSAEGIGRTVALLEQQGEAGKSLEEVLQKSVTVQKEISETLLELVRSSVNGGSRVVSETEPTPAGEPTGVGALSPGSQDLLQVFSTTTLLKERQLFEEKLEKLTALQSQYFQTSLKQQQQIAESLALTQVTTTTLLKERQLFEEKLEKLTALQSQYFQMSLKQQQQIAESLALIQLTTSRAAESRLKVALKILQTRLRQLLWPFSRRQP